MLHVRQFLSRFFGAVRECLVWDQTGATAIEYSLLAGLIAVFLYMGLNVYYEALNTVFGAIITSMREALG